MRASIKFLGALLLATALTSCGGGGGGDKPSDNGGTPNSEVGGGGEPSPPSIALSFAPTAVKTNVAIGSSATVTVHATGSEDSFGGAPVFAMVLEGSHVLSSGIELAAVDARRVSVTMHTLPVLAPGRHQGTLLIHLCKDPACVTPHKGSPVSLPYDFSVTDGPLQAHAIYATAMSVHRGETLSRQVTVSVTNPGPSTGWAATVSQPWLKVIGGTGTGAGTFQVGFQAEDLAEGRHAAEVTVRSTNGLTASVPIQLDVLPASFTLMSGTPEFSAINGAPIPAQTLSFQLNNNVNKPWRATSSAPWLQLGGLEGTTPATLAIQPDPSLGRLASGVHLADVVLTSDGVTDTRLTTLLKLSSATLSSNNLIVTLGGEKGRDWLTPSSLSLSLNTGTNRWPFTVGTLPDWLATSVQSGMVGETSTPIALSLRPEKIEAGSRSTTVKIAAQVNGDALSLPVTVNANMDQRRLLPSEWGVAMSSSPTGTALTRTVKIRDNFDGALQWTATSSAAWLQVSSNGDTLGNATMLLTADPSTLPNESVSYANVTIQTVTEGVEPAVIRVAMWRSATGLPEIKTVDATNYHGYVADRIRPYIYALRLGHIDVLNVYTGAKVGSIANMSGGASLMSVSADGSRLYSLTYNSIQVADLDTLTKVETWPLVKSTDSASAIVAARVNGVDVVFLNNGTSYARGRNLAGRVSLYDHIAASVDGTSVHTLGTRSAVDFSEMSGGMLFSSQPNFFSNGAGSNQIDLAIGHDGSRGYAAGRVSTKDGYICSGFSPTQIMYRAVFKVNDMPNNVEVTRDGRVLCGVYRSSGGTDDFRLFQADGTLIKAYKLGSGYRPTLEERQLLVSPDGFVAAARISDGFLYLVPLGAP